MRFPRFSVPLMLSAAALLVTACCRQPAQNLIGTTPAASPAATGGTDEPFGLAHTKVNIDFPGGTLGDLAGHLPKAPAEPFNLIVPEGLRAAPLPAFSVRDADSSLLASALSTVLRPQGVELDRMDQPSPGGAAVYVATKFTASTGGFRTWHLAAKDAARMTAAIEAAWSMLPGSNQLRYHPETETLFIYGARVAHDAVAGAFESAALSGRPEPR